MEHAIDFVFFNKKKRLPIDDAGWRRMGTLATAGTRALSLIRLSAATYAICTPAREPAVRLVSTTPARQLSSASALPSSPKSTFARWRLPSAAVSQWPCAPPLGSCNGKWQGGRGPSKSASDIAASCTCRPGGQGLMGAETGRKLGENLLDKSRAAADTLGTARGGAGWRSIAATEA